MSQVRHPNGKGAGEMSNIDEILNAVGTLLVSVGAIVVLLKTGGLIGTLAEKIREWKE